VSGRSSFPPFETAGMRKTTKKKSPKNESESFWEFFSKGQKKKSRFIWLFGFENPNKPLCV